jgi:hypothetical protein
MISSKMEKVPAHVPQLGTVFSPEEPGEEAESQKKLKKNGSCSFLNSQQGLISTQSSSAVARKIH